MECEGACHEHRGDVLLVEVVDKKCGCHNWGIFWYCEAAIAEDLGRGFDVRVIDAAAEAAKPNLPG